MADGQTPPPGTYQRTSRNITFTPVEEGRFVLRAETQRADGSWTTSELKYDIANCNGQLKWAPNGC
ncbi:MAG TPA: hypothetical protein VFR81_30585 [Longimicrobium sp.]|nr:hypothetical protein [Longimicrobium sp.]